MSKLTTLLRSACLAALLGSAADVALAQVTKIPGSGCPGVVDATTSGSPALGKNFSISCPPSIDRMRVMLGAQIPPLQIGPPVTCVAGCNLNLLLLVLVPRPQLALTIPNDRGLIGGVFAAQCLQTSLNRPCVLLTPALRVQIMP